MNAPPVTDLNELPPTDSPADDQLRARVYALLGALLAQPPAASILAQLQMLNTVLDTAMASASASDSEHDNNAFATAWQALAGAAQAADVDAVDDEYHDLFIGVGRGELLPYASWYRSGTLHEKPLAELRVDLQRLGIERAANVSEPEDHIASLCQTMALLIEDNELAEQQVFFNQHLAPWAQTFFSELGAANSARFYSAVARLGQAFIEFESQYLALAASAGRMQS